MQVAASHLEGARIVIIGAGAIGSVTGYRLAQAGADVTIIERAFPGSGTTGNSFAWLNSFGKTPRDYHRLNVRSARDHVDLAQELNGDWVHRSGGLHWQFSQDTARVQQIRAIVRQLHQWGYRVETATPEQVMRELEPDLFIDPELVEEVFVVPDEKWLNGVGLCHGALSAAVKRYGAKRIHDDVVGFSGAEGAPDGVQLAGGETVPADVIINAAGPEAARIAALAGASLPIRRQFGVLVSTEPAPIALRSVVHSPNIYVRPDGGWRLLLNHESYDTLAGEDITIPRNHPIGEQAIEDGRAILPGLEGIRPDGVRVGIRPMPVDGHSIVGFDPKVTGLYHIVTHSGVTLSAILSQLVTEELAGAEPAELEPYRPDRFDADVRRGVVATFE